jgi:hypothetical protein
MARSGIGCSGWPACYGRIGDPPAASAPVTTVEAFLKLVAISTGPGTIAHPETRSTPEDKAP